MALYRSEKIGGDTGSLTLTEKTSDNATLTVNYKICNGIATLNMVLIDSTVAAYGRTINNKRLVYQLPKYLYPALSITSIMCDEYTAAVNFARLIVRTDGEIWIRTDNATKLVIGQSAQAFCGVSYTL